MKLKKRYKILIGLILSLLIVLIAFPFLVKNYVNNNGKALLGRKVNLISFSINYFSGSLNLGELLIYDENDMDTFLFVHNLHINPNVTSCLNQKYIIQNVEIDGLKCNTILSDSFFNFKGIIDHFQDTSQVVKETQPIHYDIEKISLSNSYISYHDLNLGSFIAVDKCNIQVPNGMAWNHSNLKFLGDFELSSGGKVNSIFNYNLKNGSYDVALKSDKLDLQVLLPYVKDFMYIKELNGNISTDLYLKGGNSSESADIDILGTFSFNQFSLIDTFGTRLMGIENFHVFADSINAAKDLYELKAIRMDQPFMRYELFPETDNFSRLFKSSDSTNSALEATVESNIFVMIKNYVVKTLEGIKASNFSIDTVAITNAEALYIDHTMLQKFEYSVSEGNIKALQVKSNADSLLVNFNALLNQKGRFAAKGVLHPKKPEDVSINIIIDKLAMNDLSPYFIQYMAYPIKDGIFNLNSTLQVIDKRLKSENDLFLRSFNLGKKQKHKVDIKLPLKMGIAMLKDRNGNIPLNIPVFGNLDDPKYKVWKTIGRILKELLIKAANAPYKLIAGTIDSDKASSKNIIIDNLHIELSEKQHLKLDRIAKVLLENPILILKINPSYNLKTESQKMAIFFAKADYLKMGVKTDYSKSELAQIESLNIKDSIFIKFINSQTKQSPEQNLEEKVSEMYDANLIKKQIDTKVNIKLHYMYRYILAKGVPKTQLKTPSNSESITNDPTIKKVECLLAFDVIDN